MDNELRVSTLQGDDTLLLNTFAIHIFVPVTGGTDKTYQVTRKGRIVGNFQSLQEAVDWCKID